MGSYLRLISSEELHFNRFLQNSLSVALGSRTDYLQPPTGHKRHEPRYDLSHFLRH